jgi:hypothetical protein
LNVLDYRNYEDWRNLMMSCHAAGMDKDVFIDWCVGDPDYANDELEIAQLWDALRPDGGITEWYLRVDVRLAQMNKGQCPKYPSPGLMVALTSRVPHYKPPVPTIDVRSRVNYWLSEVSKGNKDGLFNAATVIREIIAEGKITPEVGVQLLENAWPIDNGHKAFPLTSRHAVRRVIASGFLTVEERMSWPQMK